MLSQLHLADKVVIKTLQLGEQYTSQIAQGDQLKDPMVFNSLQELFGEKNWSGLSKKSAEQWEPNPFCSVQGHATPLLLFVIGDIKKVDLILDI